jgi:hypothetical protein
MHAQDHAPTVRSGVLPWRIMSGSLVGVVGQSGQPGLEREPGRVSTVTKVRMTGDLSGAPYPNLAALQLLERFLRLYERGRCRCLLDCLTRWAATSRSLTLVVWDSRAK